MRKILIIEDEDAAEARLRQLLREIDKDLEFLPTIDSVKDAIEGLRDGPRPDLIFMDVQLSDGLCFKIFDAVKLDVPIIFTTAYHDYTLDAFRSFVVDYLLKPIRIDDLNRAYQKYLQFFDRTNQIQNPESKKEGPKHWVLRMGNQIRMIAHDEVAYYFSKDKISYLITFDGKKCALDQSLDAIESLISPKEYFRVNRQCILHRKSVQKMEIESKGRLLLTLGPQEFQTTSSTERSPAFKQWLYE